jgi:hypothetical protein
MLSPIARVNPLNAIFIGKETATVIPMAKSGGVPFFESVLVKNLSPHKNMPSASNSFDIWRSLPHSPIGCDDIFTPVILSYWKFPSIWIGIKFHIDEPSNIASGQSPSIAYADVSDQTRFDYLGVIWRQKGCDTERLNCDVGSLKNSGIFDLTAGDDCQNYGENPNYKSRNSGYFVMIGPDVGGGEPTPISPESIKHGRALFVIAALWVAIITFLWLLFGRS